MLDMSDRSVCPFVFPSLFTVSLLIPLAYLLNSISSMRVSIYLCYCNIRYVCIWSNSFELEM